MKVFVSKEYNLSETPRGMKMVLVGFLLLILAGYLVGLAMGVTKGGVTTQSLAQYYRGTEDGLVYPKSLMELLEVAHFHLLSMPVAYLIVAHLLFMTKFRWRFAIVALGLLGMVLNLIAPFLIRFVAAGLAWLKLTGMLAFGASLVGMIHIELFALLFGPRPTR